MYVCIDGKLYILILLQAIMNYENPFQWKKESYLIFFKDKTLTKLLILISLFQVLLIIVNVLNG